MVKKIIPLFALVALVITGCSTGKYADVKSYLQDTIKMQEKYISTIEGAKSGSEVASAIETFADGLVEMAEKGKELEKKYPELNFKDKQFPPELKAEMDKLDEVGKRMITASTSIGMKYMRDPAVLKAQMSMAKKLQALQ